MRHRRSITSGFTLLEALIVLAIFGLIVVGTLPLIHLATNQLVSSKSEEATAREVSALDTVLTKILARAQPPTLGNDRPDSFEMVGSSTEIRFVAPMPEALGGGFARYSLGSVGEGSDKRLSLSWKRGNLPATEIDLFSRISAVTFAYQVGNPENGQPLTWVDEVDPSKERVHAVRLQVTSDSVGALDRFVPLLIDRNRSCVFDTVAFDCRPGT